jgi:hypothetical protein
LVWLANSFHPPLALLPVQGLQLYDSLIIVPCMQLCTTLFGVVSGLLYFQEYHGMTQLQTAMFVLGVAIVCLGAAVLARASLGGSAAAAGHLHADQEAAKHIMGLKPMPDSFYRDVHRAAPAGSTDFRLQVAWQQGTGLTSDNMAAANQGEQGTSGCGEQLSHCPFFRDACHPHVPHILNGLYAVIISARGSGQLQCKPRAGQADQQALP